MHTYVPEVDAAVVCSHVSTLRVGNKCHLSDHSTQYTEHNIGLLLLLFMAYPFASLCVVASPGRCNRVQPRPLLAVILQFCGGHHPCPGDAHEQRAKDCTGC